jgi:small subunit ribosomal protein S20
MLAADYSSLRSVPPGRVAVNPEKRRKGPRPGGDLKKHRKRVARPRILLTAFELSRKIDFRSPECPRGIWIEISYLKGIKLMANHFSALKRARQTERRTLRNRGNTSRLRSVLRDMRQALARGDKAAAEQTFRRTVSILDKGIQKGVLHENTAARYKSRLSKRLAAIK